MDTEPILMIILAAVFIFLNGFFVLSEFCIVKVRKSRLEELVKDRVPNAKLAYKMSNSLDTYLSATQLGITLKSLALGWIGDPAVANVIESPLKKYFRIKGVAVHTISFIIAFNNITFCPFPGRETFDQSLCLWQNEKRRFLYC